MARIDLNLDDLTNSALKRMVQQMLTASDSEEKKILAKLQKKAEKNDLADLDEEMHGKPNTPQVEDSDDAFDLEAKGEDDEASEVAPKKKRK
jgi:hypothetical protein